VRARSLVVSLGVALALVSAMPAAAHLTPEPSFVAAGEVQRLVLTVHNDRDETMTGFRLTVAEGLRIVSAGGDEEWTAAVEGTRATWTGGALPPLEPVVFEVEVDAAGVAPGTAELRGDQLYADGETTTWPVPLTVVPAGESAADDAAVTGTAIAILAILATLAVATFGLVLWQRRRASLQER
jgi:hypothetical protein